MKTTPSFLLVLGLALALFLAPINAPKAFASAPLIFTMPAQPDVIYHHVCSFPLLLHSDGTGIFHVFFDKNGNFDHVIITAPQTRLTFTNLNTGKSVWTPSVNMVKEYNTSDTTGIQTLRGLLDRIVVPGQGLVSADVGRFDLLFTFDSSGNVTSAQPVFSAGIQDNQFIETVCSVLQ